MSSWYYYAMLKFVPGSPAWQDFVKFKHLQNFDHPSSCFVLTLKNPKWYVKVMKFYQCLEIAKPR